MLFWKRVTLLFSFSTKDICKKMENAYSACYLIIGKIKKTPCRTVHDLDFFYIWSYYPIVFKLTFFSQLFEFPTLFSNEIGTTQFYYRNAKFLHTYLCHVSFHSSDVEII